MDFKSMIYENEWMDIKKNKTKQKHGTKQTKKNLFN